MSRIGAAKAFQPQQFPSDSAAWVKTEKVMSMGVRRNFPGCVCNVDILLIVFRLLTLQCKWMLTRCFTVLHHKENAPWKHVLHSHLFWNYFQVELYTNLPQRCRLRSVIRYRFCWIGTY